MTDFYQIISNEDKLDEFIEWLPDSSDRFQYYFTLFARKKYFPGHPALAYDKTQIKRGVSQKINLKKKLRQLETRIGNYLGKNDIPIPNEALAVYISPSPRDMRKAAFSTIKTLATKLEDESDFNLKDLVMNEIQVSKGNEKCLLFDIDSRDTEIVQKALNLVRNNATVIQTHGGFHFLITSKHLLNKDSFDKDWYQRIKSYSDVSGDALTPIVGCFQGGFEPTFYKK